LRISDRANPYEPRNKRQNKAEKVYKFLILTIVMIPLSMKATQVFRKANALHNSTTTATACKYKIHRIQAASYSAKFGGYNIATKADLNQIHYSLQHRKIQLGQENC
jgi:hypothetical protein